MTLRGALTLAMVVLLAVALTAAAALAVLTSRLHRTTARLGTAMDNVQLAEEALVDLRTLDAMTARIEAGEGDEVRESISLGGDALRERLAALGQRAKTPVERQLLEEATRSVERYVSAAGAADAAPAARAESRGSFDDARRSIRRFLELNVERARGERATAARWDRTGDAWGFGAAALLLIGTAAVVALLRTRLFDPMIALAGSIARYGRGNTGERAPEAGFRELRQIARSFNDVADRLERQREDQLAFLAGVAHDLRNPLGALHLACRRPTSHREDAARTAARFELIERQVKKLDRLAGDFLDAARAEAGQLEIVAEPHDLRTVVRAAAELFSGLSAVHAIEVVEPSEPLVARCDLVRIEQIVNNLVGNAIKYSPDGGRVGVTLRRDGAAAVLSVEDDGVGIAPEDLTRIFQPFRRGSRLTRVVPGLGLGLATSRRIAERHGGSLDVASAHGRGSTFELRLPLLGHESVRDDAATGSPPDPEGGVHRVESSRTPR